MKLPIDMETVLVGVIVFMCIERTAEDPIFWLIAGVWAFGAVMHSVKLFRRSR